MKYQSGLTTVELIVTLFVAALFIVSGYQLYNAINLRSANVRESSEASNIAYQILRSEGSRYVVTTNTCSNPSIQSVTPSPSTLPDPSGRILRCKPDSTSNLILVTVEIDYGSYTPKRKVSHATLIAP